MHVDGVHEPFPEAGRQQWQFAEPGIHVLGMVEPRSAGLTRREMGAQRGPVHGEILAVDQRRQLRQPVPTVRASGVHAREDIVVPWTATSN